MTSKGERPTSVPFENLPIRKVPQRGTVVGKQPTKIRTPSPQIPQKVYEEPIVEPVKRPSVRGRRTSSTTRPTRVAKPQVPQPSPQYADDGFYRGYAHLSKPRTPIPSNKQAYKEYFKFVGNTKRRNSHGGLGFGRNSGGARYRDINQPNFNWTDIDNRIANAPHRGRSAAAEFAEQAYNDVIARSPDGTYHPPAYSLNLPRGECVGSMCKIRRPRKTSSKARGEEGEEEVPLSRKQTQRNKPSASKLKGTSVTRRASYGVGYDSPNSPNPGPHRNARKGSYSPKTSAQVPNVFSQVW